MKKQLWLTSLTSDRSIPSAVSAKLGPYGFDVAGSIWNDDIDRMGWQESRDLLINPAIAAWLVVTTGDELAKPSVRYGLSLLALSVAAARPGLPMFIICCGGSLPAAGVLPVPLARAVQLTFEDPAFCARIVAKTSVPLTVRAADYRLDITGDPQVGQWFEVGSAGGGWKGALFGVCGAEINFQAVGPAGTLPKDTVLNYPVQGMQLTLGNRDFTAWGVQNELPSGTSLLVRVKGMPESIVFGPFPESDEAELYTLQLI